MRMKISENVVWRDLDGEIVILNLTSGVYFSVDGVGARGLDSGGRAGRE